MFERFTDRARKVVVLAQEEARLLNHDYIGTEHILLGLIQEDQGLACKALESLGVSLEAVRSQVREMIGEGQAAPTGHIPFTPRAKKVLELSLREAFQLGHDYIGTEHILLGVVREGEGVGAQALQKLGVDLARVRKTVLELSGSTDLEERTGATERVADLPLVLAEMIDRGRRLGALADRLATDLAAALDDDTITPELILAGLQSNPLRLRTLEMLVADESLIESAIVELEERRRQQPGEPSEQT
jgi:ATP-dependent Clp protease ATP-binding subunit ClpC